jgi:hypothetical protein
MQKQMSKSVPLVYLALQRLGEATGRSTAVELALKMAFRRFLVDHPAVPPETDLGVLGLEGAYHGDTLGAMDAVAPSIYNARQTPWYRSPGDQKPPPPPSPPSLFSPPSICPRLSRLPPPPSLPLPLQPLRTKSSSFSSPALSPPPCLHIFLQDCTMQPDASACARPCPATPPCATT